MEKDINKNNRVQHDYELVRKAVQEHDQKAFAELLGQYRDPIYFLLLKMVTNREDAEDLTIETFAKAFRSLPNFRPDYAFSTWLFRIATNGGIDFLRKKKLKTLSIEGSKTGKDGDPVRLDVRSADENPEQELITAEKAEMLRSFVEKLKPRYRNLIELRYYKQLSYEEIATETGLPLGTVKAQLFRARDLLSQVMQASREKL
jgi:RNA polymerase sigma-70 factor (ECF subfamily)